MAQTIGYSAKVKEARLALHLTQQELADLIGCSQSSISYIENGVTDVLSIELLQKLSNQLGIELPENTSPVPGPTQVLAYCTNSDCPCGVANVISGRLAIRPALYSVAGGATPVYCKACGTELSTLCKHCLTPLVQGAAFCVGCGNPLVELPSSVQRVDPEKHARTLRNRAAEYRESLSAVETLPTPQWRNNEQNRRRPTIEKRP